LVAQLHYNVIQMTIRKIYINISLKSFPGGDKFPTGKTPCSNKKTSRSKITITKQTKRCKGNIFHIKMHINNKWNQPNDQNRNSEPETKAHRDAQNRSELKTETENSKTVKQQKTWKMLVSRGAFVFSGQLLIMKALAKIMKLIFQF